MIFDPQAYGGAAPLLVDAPRNPLGPGRPKQAVAGALAALTPEQLVAPRPLADRRMAQACLAALWLRYDFFDESHRISQDLATTTGSYWHGILHRREPDFANAKYWFHRVHEHPIFAPLAADAAQLARQAKLAPAGWLVEQTSWDPFRFVDLCEQAEAGPAALVELCSNIQQREWEWLFDHAYRAAAGPSGSR